ncbi:MAG: 2-oxoacid:acceptor oxidoreductase family protein [Dethiobacteria bacterium]|jgi:2-oxoglutarate ferredoxin oxidoreductase subunit gamma
MGRMEMRLSGSGGQGLILAAIILAEAAASEGKNVVQTQSYGPEARGGASKAEVIIDDAEIDYPVVTEPEVLLCMSEKAYEKYVPSFKGKTLILDSTFIDSCPEIDGVNVYSLPITKLAREKVGRQIVANIVALGALNGIVKIIDDASLEQAVLNRAPKGTEEMNKKALEVGLELVR